MNSGAMEILMMLFMFMSGGSSNNDALDMMTSDSYWRAKSITVSVEQLVKDSTGGEEIPADTVKMVQDLSSTEFSVRDSAKTRLASSGIGALPALKKAVESKDPEVAATASDLIIKLSAHIKEREIRRLMAIRTLGERKEKSASALLKTLSDSTEPFVADYARRSISQIGGASFKRPDRHGDLTADLALMPKDTGIVGQTTGIGIPGFSLDSTLAQYFDVANVQGQAGGMGQRPIPPKQQVVDRLTKEVINYTERLGNVRADGVTVGLSNDIAGDRNWVVMSFRGQYDVKALLAMLREVFPPNRGNNGFFEFQLTELGDIPALVMEREVTVLFPSDHQIVLIVVEDRKVPSISVLLPVVMGIMGNKGALANNAEMDGMIKAVDKTGPVWAVGHITPGMKREIPFLASFDEVTASSKEEKDGIHLTLKARGDVVEMKGAINMISPMLMGALVEIKRETDKVKQLQPLLDFLSSLKLATDDTGATATAVLSTEAGKAMLAAMNHELGWSLQRLSDNGQPNGIPAEITPPPP